MTRQSGRRRSVAGAREGQAVASQGESASMVSPGSVSPDD
jgi:hypothetical protein